MSYRVPRYEYEVRHSGLNKFQIIRDRDPFVAEQKANAKLAQWDEMWKRKQLAESNRKLKESGLSEAEFLTEQFQKRLEEARTILDYTLDVDDAIDWSSLLDRRVYAVRPPEEPRPSFRKYKPCQEDTIYLPKINPILNLIPYFKNKEIAFRNNLYEKDYEDYLASERNADRIDRINIEKYQHELSEYNEKKSKLELEINDYNEKIRKRESGYKNKDLSTIEEYCDMVLENSNYPDWINKSWNLLFDDENMSLVIDYDLPMLEEIPNEREAKYVITRKEVDYKYISNTERNKLYDSIIFQIALRTVHELFEADVINVIKMITFNGYVKDVDKSKGHMVRSCVLSYQTSKDEFMAINLRNVDPKECIKGLKGIYATKLHSITPVQPIISIDRNDKRISDSYEVANKLDQSINLAAMDWQDFEHLVRELFEKEFSASGGEVRVTQASRDGGVDALAYDPDPIRGGKIVIQAKRYTNVVGVSSVRDLYGTVLNEGATKGILITTSNFGPDAHAFAKDKPLTLMNGSNLLYLLEKHGHQAHIDTQKAKEIMRSMR